ncbi:MAG: FAD binding domain-containing protein, partial [Candidatus Cloacimonetes bacterium]|nr:FAD binding domain-containing protein [Candidatus Cloacimonadota bacterium]
GEKYYLAGGTDINIQIKKDIIRNGTILFINHFKELNGIKEDENYILIGSTTTFKQIIEFELLNKKLPFFQNSLKNFASPIIQSLATIGGNIANGSPTSDVVPLLLVLDAKLELISYSMNRIINLKDFFIGYKKFIMKPNEIIKSIFIPRDAENGFTTFYKKIGSRKALSIAKIAVAGLKKVVNNEINEIKIAIGSLNEYPRRLDLIEDYLLNKDLKDIDFKRIRIILKEEITPITDLRSDKDYRFEVCLNLIKKFLLKPDSG